MIEMLRGCSQIAKPLLVLIDLGCNLALFARVRALFIQKRYDSRRHLVHEEYGQGIYLAGMAGGEVDHARLIAAHYAGSFYINNREGNAQDGQLATMDD